MADIDIAAADSLAAQRQQEIEQLYVHNYEYIRELIYSDPHTTLETQQQITEGIARHLASYDDALSDGAFRTWATEIIVPLVGFHAIRRVSERFIHAAIWRTLRHSS